MSNAVELTGVTKRFGQQTAVEQVDLAVPEGAIYGFIGPNGSGKTTTLRMILRIFQPDEGRVTVLGSHSGRTADSRLGYLPEERGLYKRMRVREVIGYYAKLKGSYDYRREMDDWLDRLDATSWADKRIDALSKGMAQKIQFITSVIARPQLLILDEPFSGLDPVNLDVLREAVLQMRERGTTIIFSTHDMDVAERLCDTIFMIFEGRKVLDGSVDSIQQTYARNQVLLRLSEGSSVPRLNGVERLESEDRTLTLSLSENVEPQQVLEQLVQAGSRVERFELQRPSLHDIFVSIARPEQQSEKNGGVA